jgi:hypothetical protein
VGAPVSSFVGCPGKACPTGAALFDADCARRQYPECSYLIDGLARFFNQGVKPGHFLSAVLSNDLQETYGRADDVSRGILPRLMELLYNHAPSAAWGSARQFEAWRAEK